MNILIISQSRVEGIVIEQSLKKEKSFSLSMILNEEQKLLEKILTQKDFNAIIYLNSKNENNTQKKLDFLHQIVGCPIIVLDEGQHELPQNEWLNPLFKFPFNPVDPDYPKKMDLLISILKEKYNRNTTTITNHQKEDLNFTAKQKTFQKNKIEIIAIGASTGGPQVLEYIFKHLPAAIPVPILVVQHMPQNFLPLFINWLNNASSLPITIATDGQKVEPGHVYFAPGNRHMILQNKKQIKIIDAPPMHSVKPAVSYLFNSVAKIYGPKAMGILLTGMGKDGAYELGLMKEEGAFTIVQDKKSSVVFGMPGVAFKIGAACAMLSPEEIVQKIKSIFNL